MKIKVAHLRERSTSGGWIDFAVFDARSSSRSKQDDAKVLADLTSRFERSGYKVDQSALAYRQHGRDQYYGDPELVKHLSRRGVGRWTHTLDV